MDTNASVWRKSEVLEVSAEKARLSYGHPFQCYSRFYEPEVLSYT